MVSRVASRHKRGQQAIGPVALVPRGRRLSRALRQQSHGSSLGVRQLVRFRRPLDSISRTGAVVRSVHQLAVTACRLGATAVAILTTSVAAQRTPSASPLFGALVPGRYAVGFRKIELRDPMRYELPKLGGDGRPVTTDRTRRFTVHIWYPAAAASARAMTFADYMFSHFADTVSDATRRGDEANRLRFFAQFGTVSDSTWRRLMATPLLRRRDAPTAAGRFPLIV